MADGRARGAGTAEQVGLDDAGDRTAELSRRIPHREQIRRVDSATRAVGEREQKGWRPHLAGTNRPACDRAVRGLFEHDLRVTVPAGDGEQQLCRTLAAGRGRTARAAVGGVAAAGACQGLSTFARNWPV